MKEGARKERDEDGMENECRERERERGVGGDRIKDEMRG